MSALVVLVLLLAVVGPVVLYYLVRSEHDQRRELSREEAERAARRDTRGDPDADRDAPGAGRDEDDHQRAGRDDRE